VEASLVEALKDLNEQEVLKIVEKRLHNNEDPLKILNDARKGMEIVGDKFESGEYYLGELVYSGEILKQVSKVIKPRLQQESGGKSTGTVVIGSVAGDLHDIGKNIVTFLLEANGFEVHDLGVDVPPQKFVEKIRETNAKIVGLSGLLTATIDSMKSTVEVIKSSDLDDVKVIIGGAPVDENTRQYTGADAYGKDALDGVSKAKKWAV